MDIVEIDSNNNLNLIKMDYVVEYAKNEYSRDLYTFSLKCYNFSYVICNPDKNKVKSIKDAVSSINSGIKDALIEVLDTNPELSPLADKLFNILNERNNG